MSAATLALSVAGCRITITPSAAGDEPHVVINEAYLTGGSVNAPYSSKFVELYNPTEAAVDVTGWSVQYRSATARGAFTGVIPLSGSIAPGGYYLVEGGSNGTAGGALPEPDAVGTVNFQGQNGTLALATTSTALNPGTGNLVGKAGIVDLVGYGAANTFETKSAPAGRPGASGGSLNRTAFVDTDDNSRDFTVADAVTPTNSGGATAPEPEPGTVTTIPEIQGSGTDSPLVGATVTTRGIVTATYPTGGYGGLYLQAPGTGGDADATPGVSDAVFVFSEDAATDLAVGQYVEVTGVVSEHAGLTEITPDAGGWTVVDEPVEAVKPATVAFPATDAEREALEGMLVQPAGEYRVADNHDTNYYGSVVLSAGTDPVVQPTEAGRPGSDEATAAAADAAARKVVLDDGASINFNSGANTASPLPYLTPESPVRVGAAVTFTAPVILDYRFDAWEFQPTGQLTAENAAAVQPAQFTNTREEEPRDVGGDLTVATFNVLNYFATTGDQFADCTYYEDRDGNPITVSGGCEARGAADAASLARQQDKIVAAINALGADVVSLEEIENSSRFGKDRDFALSTLVDALNASAGADTWAFVPSPSQVPAVEDVIRTAYIYRTASAEPVGDSRILDDAAFVNARQPLAQVFQPVGGVADGSDDVVVIANHFKSKGSGTGDDADAGDGQGASNASRVRQADALVAFAADVEAEGGTDKALLVGDFNSYGHEDPVTAITDAGYTDLGSATGEYTYVFDGAVGSLDHVFASAGAAGIVTGADIWNINSVEPIANEYSRYNYNATILYDATPFRSSDHDPIIVGLDLVTNHASVDLDLIGINDFHGRIDANTVKFAGTVEQLRAENPDGSVFVSAGDNIGASLFASALAKDQPTIDVLNALDLSASAVGNHEFDQGFEDLTNRVDDSVDWSYLGANVYTAGTTTPALPEYKMVEVNGLEVAFVGVVTEETSTLVAPSGIADVEFGDPVEALNRVTDRLKDGDASNGEADVVVALVHEGAGAGTPDGATLDQEVAAGGAFAEIVTQTDPRVAAILTGHTHKQYAWDAPITGTDRTRPILQTGSYGEFVGYVSLTVDTATNEVTAYTAENVARSTAADADLVAAYPSVAKVKGIVDAALVEAGTVGNQPVGSVAADITTAFAGGTYGLHGYTGPGPQPTSGRDNRGAESALGRLVANSLVATLADPARGGADIGVVNPGGMRAELMHDGDGVITYAEANAVLPFVNNLWTVSLTGAQVVELLEQQWQTDAAGNRPSRPYLALSLSDNVTYTVDTADPNAAPGGHVTSVTINGVPLDPQATYRVATFSFLATGGDNFRVFTSGTDARDSGLVDRDAWISYLQGHAGLAPEFDRSSVVVAALPRPVQAGSSTSIDLSRLDLTSLGSPQNTVVSAYLVAPGAVLSAANPGPAVGTGTVTKGAARLPVTIPGATAPGDYGLVVVAQPSGTVVRIPLSVTAAPAPPTTTVNVTSIHARSQCVNGTAHVAVDAVNGESVALDIRFITPFAEKKFAGVAPGMTSYNLFSSGLSSVPAGTATVAAYYWDGAGHYQRYDVAYEAIRCE